MQRAGDGGVGGTDAFEERTDQAVEGDGVGERV